ncbi:{NirD} Ferredoxin subunits of nitrite reductase and ring-hydroxylating dioxygenases [Methylophilaceae bacterium]|jgi:nitrite reductase/ring-hydroxylating ferredoxin subunit
MQKHTIVLNSYDLVEKALGIRFALPQLGELVTGFTVRYHGKAYAYVNKCAHVPIELDWKQGEFFTVDKDYLICATHGAHYAPDTGYCVMGPCKGKSLQALHLTEQNNQITIHLEQLKKNL